MDAAALAGISEEEFWTLTPREIDRKMWATREIARRGQRLALQTAWQIDAFRRQKRLQSLTTLLTTARKLTGEEKQQRQSEHDELTERMTRGKGISSGTR